MTIRRPRITISLRSRPSSGEELEGHERAVEREERRAPGTPETPAPGEADKRGAGNHAEPEQVVSFAACADRDLDEERGHEHATEQVDRVARERLADERLPAG